MARRKRNLGLFPSPAQAIPRSRRGVPLAQAVAAGAKARPLRDLSSVFLGALHGATGIAFSSRPGVPLAQAVAARAAGRPLPDPPIFRGTSPEAFEQARPIGQVIAGLPLAGGLVRATARRAAALAGVRGGVLAKKPYAGPALPTVVARKVAIETTGDDPVRRRFLFHVVEGQEYRAGGLRPGSDARVYLSANGPTARNGVVFAVDRTMLEASKLRPVGGPNAFFAYEGIIPESAIINLGPKSIGEPFPIFEKIASGLAIERQQLIAAGKHPIAEKLIQALKEARPIRAGQEALYSAERSRRLGKALTAGQKAPGEAGARRTLGALKGELPKARFEPVRPLFSQAEVDELFDAVKSSPLLPGYSRISAISGLTKLLHPVGVGVPQASELQLLSRVFGQEFVREVTRNQGAVPGLIEALGIPRAIKATLDLSAPLRQGLVAGVRYPKQFVRAFGDMFRAAAREESYQALKQGIVNRPTFRLMDEAKLALTGLDEGTLLAREEQFISRLPEAIPVFGRAVRASNRAYTGFLMKLRADVFDELLKRSASAGVPQTEELFAGIAKFVNAATGRGDLGALSRAGSQLSTVLFSPRLLASRINLLDIRGLPGIRNVTGGGFYMSLPPFVRREALKSMLNLAAFGGTVLGLAGLGGARVGKDARSADFGKFIVGNTRTDIWGGFQQYPRIAFQLARGELVSTTTGKTIRLGEGFRPLTRKKIAQRFFESKANPLIGAILEVLDEQTFEGEKPTIRSTARRLLTPLLAEDLYDIAKDDPSLLPLIIPGIFGAGVQTYGPRGTRRKRVLNP